MVTNDDAEAADHTEFMELLLTIIFGKKVSLRYPPQTEKEVSVLTTCPNGAGITRAFWTASCWIRGVLTITG